MLMPLLVGIALCRSPLSTRSPRFRGAPIRLRFGFILSEDILGQNVASAAAEQWGLAIEAVTATDHALRELVIGFIQARGVAWRDRPRTSRATSGGDAER
jgi:hypothetical protein